ncbi:hypothetical protein GGD65_004217 [Bradyrhizobium sp. CIR18]|uniref:PAN domain-containing protein n=1 Tax=Bradyrhizobium sp. CIR18 TaxID=2663839 RepID=UPI0016061D95|nr:PAN domain-containing protein [Bradyrhizobium sp. CIR18]MBB4363180.1 hypothetical protein [Bradyrhizobium sp. CIR18]
MRFADIIRAACAATAFLFFSAEGALANSAADFCATAPFWPPDDQKEADPDIQNIFSQLRKYYPRFKRIKTIKGAGIAPQADVCPDGTSIMLFPQKFLDAVRQAPKGGDAYWKWVFIFAHEYSHVALNHNLVDTVCRQGKKAMPEPCIKLFSSEFSRGLELEADFWAAFTMGRMGATLDETTAALKSMATEDEDDSHPSYAVRIKNVSDGWGQGSPSESEGRPTSDILNSFTMRPNYDIPGREFYSFPTPSILACAAKCTGAHPETCAAFSYDKWAQFCYLKRAEIDLAKEKGRPFSSQDLVLKFDVSSDTGIPKSFGKPRVVVKDMPGTIPVTEDQRKNCNLFDSLARTRFYGAASPMSPPIPSSTACLSRCRGDPKCNAVQFADGKCTFYSTIGSTFPVAGKRTVISFRRYAYDPECSRQK